MRTDGKGLYYDGNNSDSGNANIIIRELTRDGRGEFSLMIIGGAVAPRDVAGKYQCTYHRPDLSANRSDQMSDNAGKFNSEARGQYSESDDKIVFFISQMPLFTNFTYLDIK